MTAVVGLVDGTRVWMGADTGGADGCEVGEWPDGKIFRRDVALVGYTTSFRMGQLLRYALRVPDPFSYAWGELSEYVATKFVDAVRECLKVGGWAEEKDKREQAGEFLVGLCGKAHVEGRADGALFVIQSDYAVRRVGDGFAAIGCGANVCLGALYAARNLDPIPRMSVALEAAARFNGHVRPPFQYVALECGSGDP